MTSDLDPEVARTYKGGIKVDQHGTTVSVVTSTQYGSHGSYVWAPVQAAPEDNQSEESRLPPALDKLLVSIQGIDGDNVTQVTITYNPSGLVATITCSSEKSACHMAAALRERGDNLTRVERIRSAV